MSGPYRVEKREHGRLWGVSGPTYQPWSYGSPASAEEAAASHNAAYAAGLAAGSADREALVGIARELLAEAELCFRNHYGENPEGGPTPTHIERARALFSRLAPKEPGA